MALDLTGSRNESETRVRHRGVQALRQALTIPRCGILLPIASLH
jgi:hypothetical protein